MPWLPLTGVPSVCDQTCAPVLASNANTRFAMVATRTRSRLPPSGICTSATTRVCASAPRVARQVQREQPPDPALADGRGGQFGFMDIRAGAGIVIGARQDG